MSGMSIFRIMLRKDIPAIVITAVLPVLLGSMVRAARDTYTLSAPNGVTFSEVREYETWPDVAVSRLEDGLKAIVGNPAMINAYRDMRSVFMVQPPTRSSLTAATVHSENKSVARATRRSRRPITFSRPIPAGEPRMPTPRLQLGAEEELVVMRSAF
jgi:hypothetical protein